MSLAFGAPDGKVQVAGVRSRLRFNIDSAGLESQLGHGPVDSYLHSNTPLEKGLENIVLSPCTYNQVSKKCTSDQVSSYWLC